MVAKIITDRITKIEDKVIVAGFFSDVRPLKGLAGEIDWLFNGQISKLILDGKLTGENIFLSGVCAPEVQIPEFSLIMMPLIAIIGIGLLLFIKKNRKML